MATFFMPRSVAHALQLIECLGSIGTLACLPIPTTRLTSPPIKGRYYTASGAPIAGLSVGIAANTCTDLRAETTTDSSGAFHLDATKTHDHFILLLPIDVATAPTFWLCAGQHGTLSPIFRGYARGHDAQDMLTCTQSPGADTDYTRVRCAGEGYSGY